MMRQPLSSIPALWHPRLARHHTWQEVVTFTDYNKAVPDTTPEVNYNDSLPEAHGNENPTEEHLQVTKLARKWPWIVLGLILAAAIAVGVSVGIWHHREHSLLKPSRVSRYGSCLAQIFSWLTFIARRRLRIRKSHRIRTSHMLLNTSLMIHLWQLCSSPMGTDTYFSRIILVSSDVRFVLRPTANGSRARISMPLRILLPTPRDLRR